MACTIPERFLFRIIPFRVLAVDFFKAFSDEFQTDLSALDLRKHLGCRRVDTVRVFPSTPFAFENY